MSNSITETGSPELPPEFTENVLRICGDRGAAWLRDLPLIIAELERRWKVSVCPSFPGLSYNFVAPALLAGGEPAVVKLGLPIDDDEIYSETAYLREISGDGVVRLIDADGSLRALLLERALPGDDLRAAFHHDPSGAVDAAVGVLQQLCRKQPKNGEFISLQRWAAKLSDAERWDFPADKARRAAEIFESAEADKNVLLHGDFHHTNILSCGGSFLAIDPKGLIGRVEYDIAVFLNNHRGWLRNEPDLRHLLTRAVEKFADAFELPAPDIRRWAFAQKVLAAFWTMTEGSSRWRDQLASADVWDV